MTKIYTEKGKNSKGLWIVEVRDANRTYADTFGKNILIETKAFTSKKAMQTWLKAQTN